MPPSTPSANTDTSVLHIAPGPLEFSHIYPRSARAHSQPANPTARPNNGGHIPHSRPRGRGGGMRTVRVFVARTRPRKRKASEHDGPRARRARAAGFEGLPPDASILARNDCRWTHRFSLARGSREKTRARAPNTARKYVRQRPSHCFISFEDRSMETPGTARLRMTSTATRQFYLYLFAPFRCNRVAPFATVKTQLLVLVIPQVNRDCDNS